jgi:hypothetical protein
MAKTFEKWKIDEVIDTFGIKRIYDTNYLPLAEWLEAKTVLTDFEKLQIEKLRVELQINAEYWNEDELKFFFISPFLNEVNLKSPYYKMFTQRPISGEVKGILMNGIVDLVLAKGEAAPKKPFFFIHEYKQEQKGNNDPIAQLVTEMLVAQAQNESEMPLYGCYVMGRFWFFVVLKGNEYAVSDAYTATQDDIYQIVSILRAVKMKIEESVKQEQSK